MGIIVPVMGTPHSSSGIAGALFSPVQQRVLGLLFGQPNRVFRGAELIRLAGSGTGATHRVITTLAATGLVTVTRVGNQKHYRANQRSPVFNELRGLIVKTVGLVEPLRRALAPKAGEIRAAFVYGSVARASDRAGSDIDLMVISDSLGYPDLFHALQAAERAMGRPVNPNVMTLADWRTKQAASGSFAARVAAAPRLWVFGSPDDVA